MRRIGLVAIVVLAAPFLAAPPASAADPARVDPTTLVNPLIGTANGGNVFPGAVLPFGMFSFSPENSRGNQTRTAAPGGYRFEVGLYRPDTGQRVPLVDGSADRVVFGRLEVAR